MFTLFVNNIYKQQSDNLDVWELDGEQINILHIWISNACLVKLAVRFLSIVTLSAYRQIHHLCSLERQWKLICLRTQTRIPLCSLAVKHVSALHFMWMIWWKHANESCKIKYLCYAASVSSLIFNSFQKAFSEHCSVKESWVSSIWLIIILFIFDKGSLPGIAQS